MPPTRAEGAAAAALLLLSGDRSVAPMQKARSPDVLQGMARARAIRQALQDIVAMAGVAGGVGVGVGDGVGGVGGDGASGVGVSASDPLRQLGARGLTPG